MSVGVVQEVVLQAPPLSGSKAAGRGSYHHKQSKVKLPFGSYTIELVHCHRRARIHPLADDTIIFSRA